MGLRQRIKLLIFDFDGTLHHLNVDWHELRRRLALSDGESLGQVIQQLVLSRDPRLDVVTRLELVALDHAPMRPEILRLLAKLRARYHLAVLTRNSRYVVQRAFESTELENVVFVVGREDVSLQKPDPAGVQIVLDHFGVESTEAVLVGDTYHDVEAARAAGIAAIVVRNPNLAYAPGGAAHYLDELAELEWLLT